MAVQYRDLPLIPQSLDESPYLGWGGDQANQMSSYKHQYGNNSPGEDFYYTDSYDNGMVMNRFMQDQYPLAPGLLHANVPVQRSLGHQYELQYTTAEYHRHVSPCSSGRSSVPSQNELHTPHTYYPTPYGKPKDIFTPMTLPYPTTDHFQDDGYMSQASLHGGCSLRELEYNHPEPIVENVDDTEVKGEAPVEHQHGHIITTKVEALSEELREYTDSGIGNSVRDAESVQPIDLEEDPASDSDYSPTSKSSGKRRRPSASNAGSNKGSKRRRATRKDSAMQSPTSPTKCPRKRRGAASATKSPIDDSDERRHFPCPLATYGCPSDFSSKNEWKRHVSTQHIKLWFWRCDLCPPTTDPQDDNVLYYNDFNRKDLFTQHLRRMHAASPKDNQSRSQLSNLVTDDNLAEHQTRCLQQLRKPPQHSVCLFCDDTFEGPSSWEARMDHVGKHFEKDKKSITDMHDCNTWNEDRGLEVYLLEEGLVAREGGQWRIGDGKPNRSVDGTSDSEEE